MVAEHKCVAARVQELRHARCPLIKPAATASSVSKWLLRKQWAPAKREDAALHQLGGTQSN